MTVSCTRQLVARSRFAAMIGSTVTQIGYQKKIALCNA